MADVTENQVRTVLALFLLFSTGNQVNDANWAQVEAHLSGPGALPHGVTSDSMRAAASTNAVVLNDALAAFQAYTTGVNFLWDGSTKCPPFATILKMFPQ